MSERGANSHQNFSGIFPSRTKRFSFRLKKAINFREERVVLNPLFVYPCKWSALVLFETHPPPRFLFPEGPQVLALNKVLAQFGIENYLSVHLSHAPAFRKPNCRERQPAVGTTRTAYGVQKEKLSRVSRVAESSCTLQRYSTVSNLSLVCFCLRAIVSFESSSLGATNNCT